MAKSAVGINSGVLHQFGHFDECLDQQQFHTNASEDDPTELIVRSKYCLVDVQMDGFTMQTVASRQKEVTNSRNWAYIPTYIFYHYFIQICITIVNNEYEVCNYA